MSLAADARSIVLALVGGVLIALPLAAMLLATGRIAGLSGILGGALRRSRGDTAWRWAFVAGCLAGGLVIHALRPGWFDAGVRAPLPVVAASGLLVGVGTRMSNGCTSGHGLCGTSRLSPRSIVATCIFMAGGIASAVAARHLLGIG